MDPGHEGIKGGVLILTEIEERRIVPSKQRISRGTDIYSRMAHFRPTKPSGMPTPLLTLVRSTRVIKLTWLVLGGDPAARSHRVEQFTAR